MSKIKVRISETKFRSFYKTLDIRMTNNVLDFRYENPSDANDRISTTSDASIQSPVKKSEK